MDAKMTLYGLWYFWTEEHWDYADEDKEVLIGLFSSPEKRDYFIAALKPILERKECGGHTDFSPFQTRGQGKLLLRDIAVDSPLLPTVPIVQLLTQMEDAAKQIAARKDDEQRKQSAKDAALAKLTPEERRTLGVR